jgi:hypothetical protein
MPTTRSALVTADLGGCPYRLLGPGRRWWLTTNIGSFGAFPRERLSAAAAAFQKGFLFKASRGKMETPGEIKTLEER